MYVFTQVLKHTFIRELVHHPTVNCKNKTNIDSPLIGNGVKGTGEMAQQLKALTAFPEFLSSDPFYLSRASPSYKNK